MLPSTPRDSTLAAEPLGAAEIRLMQILTLEYRLDQNELSTERQNELTGIDGIDVTTWQRNHEGLLIPPNEAYKLEVLRACHDSGIAGHWGRHRTCNGVTYIIFRYTLDHIIIMYPILPRS